MDAYLAPLVADRDFSGTVLISLRGKLVVERSYGFANVELSVPSGETTRYAIGSVSKTMTAAAILILRNDGKLALSDAIGRFIPTLPYGGRVTIEQLLEHTAGVPDYYLFPEYFAGRSHPVSLDEVTTLLAKKPLDFEPGSKSSYSNSGYALLAAVVEKASGIRYGDFLRRRLFEPLDMKDSGDLAESPIPERLATGYDPGYPPSGLERPVSVDPSWLEGSGSLFSTAQDLLRFAEAVRSGKLVAIAREKYPYGWGKRDESGRTFWEQNGRIPMGYVSYLAVHPDEDLVVVVLGNIQVDLAERIGHGLAEIARGNAADPIPVPAAILSDRKAAASFAGRYEIAPGFVLTVRAGEKGLGLAGPEGDVFPLVPMGSTRFFYRLLWIPVTFERDDSGATTSLDWGGQFRARRVGD